MMRKYSLIYFMVCSFCLAFSVVHASDEKSKRERHIKFVLCNYVDGASVMPSKISSDESLKDFIYKEAGIELKYASTSEIKEKLKLFWSDRPAATNEKSDRGFPYCDRFKFRGSILKLAALTSNDKLIVSLINNGADINMIDNESGKTVLDDYLDSLISRSIGKYEYSGPYNRDPLRISLKNAKLDYEKLRSYGARHSLEVNSGDLLSASENKRDCLKTIPEDISDNVSNYGGGIKQNNFGELTPGSVPGAITVSARQSACLIRSLGNNLMIVAVVSDKIGIPGAWNIPAIGRSGSVNDHQQLISDIFFRAINGPILVYCHSINCFLSYNAALRLSHAGAKEIYWLREGIKGWKDGGYPTRATKNAFFTR